jgi:hypothetical protein
MVVVSPPAVFDDRIKRMNSGAYMQGRPHSFAYILLCSALLLFSIYFFFFLIIYK